jgi:hypothetical protein
LCASQSLKAGIMEQDETDIISQILDKLVSAPTNTYVTTEEVLGAIIL